MENKKYKKLLIGLFLPLLVFVGVIFVKVFNLNNYDFAKLDLDFNLWNLRAEREMAVEKDLDSINNNHFYPEEAVEPIRLLFFGDLMLDRHVGEKIDKYGLDYLLEKLNEDNFSSGYDLVGANLEGAVTNSGEHYRPDNLYDFAFSPDIIRELKKYNFSFFGLANNHLSDQGALGITETYQNLSELGFYYSGCRDAFLSESDNFLAVSAGENQPVLTEDNCSEIILNIKNKKVALISFSSVYKNVDENEIIQKIKKIKELSDWVIVNVHFGSEYQPQASLSQENLARKMVDNGADIIIGHHPHVSQNYEIYQQKPIFYSLGNFIFDQYFSVETQEGLAVSLVLNDSGEIQFTVYKIKTRGSKIEEIAKIL